MMQTWLIIVAIAIAVLVILLLIRVRYNLLIATIWRDLKSQPTNTFFTQEMVADLDKPVQKYLLHAIAPGTPLATYVELKMSGSFRLKPDTDWLMMQASQIISTSPGFVWKATVGNSLKQFSGADYYSKGKGKMRFSIWGLLPVVNAQNNNINRSGIGRLGGEYIWLPSALLPQNQVAWQAINNHTIQADFTVDNEPISLTLTIDSEGKLLKFSLPRWGDRTEQGDWQYIPFGGEVQAEKTFGGYTIPATINAGWWFGTENYVEFFRATIEQAQFSRSRSFTSFSNS